MATNDITSHKYADTIPDAISAISLKTPKYPSINLIINAHLLEGSQAAAEVIIHDKDEDIQSLDVETDLATIQVTPKYSSINWVVSKAAATEIHVEDADFPMAIETDEMVLETTLEDNDSPIALEIDKQSDDIDSEG